MNNEYDIFISYRRCGLGDKAEHIAELLKKKGYSVFFDRQTITSSNWHEQIFHSIANCHDFILIFSEESLTRCTTDEDDWIIREFQQLLLAQGNHNIIPIMIGSDYLPKSIPEGLELIRHYNIIYTNALENYSKVIDVLQKDFLKSKPHVTRIKSFKIIMIISLCLIIAGLAFFLIRNI